MNFDPRRKESECRNLVLDPVPPLVPGGKAPKDDWDTLTLCSSPTPSEAPLTPIKSFHKGSTIELRSNTELAFGIDTVALQDQNISKELEKNEDGYSVISVVAADGDRVNGPQLTKPPARNADLSGLDQTTTEFTKISSQSQSTGSDTVMVAMPNLKTNDALCKSKETNLRTSTVRPMNDTTVMIETSIQDTIKSNLQPFSKSTKQPNINPTLGAIDTITTMQKAMYALSTPIIPAKRPAPIYTPCTVESKRTDFRTEHPKVTQVGTPGGSASPKPLSIERQMTEQRKKLQSLRKKRAEMAEKQRIIDMQMEPYKKRMAEELERLNADMMDEELAFTEEHDHFAASLEMLKEFKQAESGK
ncbi:hypothetical protein IAQ61_001818 [Plenodomus lingam]|nr:hypothetical protein IAQ61_001818 [Plenodomus lingam]